MCIRDSICIRRPLPCATKATSNKLVFCLFFFIFAFCSSRPTVVMNGVAARNGLTAKQWANPSTEKQVKKKKHRTEDSSRAGDRGLVADDAMSRSSWLLFRHPSESEWGAGHCQGTKTGRVVRHSHPEATTVRRKYFGAVGLSSTRAFHSRWRILRFSTPPKIPKLHAKFTPSRTVRV